MDKVKIKQKHIDFLLQRRTLRCSFTFIAMLFLCIVFSLVVLPVHVLGLFNDVEAERGTDRVEHTFAQNSYKDEHVDYVDEDMGTRMGTRRKGVTTSIPSIKTTGGIITTIAPSLKVSMTTITPSLKVIVKRGRDKQLKIPVINIMDYNSTRSSTNSIIPIDTGSKVYEAKPKKLNVDEAKLLKTEEIYKIRQKKQKQKPKQKKKQLKKKNR
mmetsp:Transcript_24394/g.48583  ORF Transcript_24394/g.48583 Transcript_24394/m.48583 type:complete len:212 (-) Transcript_24394:148-783(-)